jgi:hypothetical protein
MNAGMHEGGNVNLVMLKFARLAAKIGLPVRKSLRDTFSASRMKDTANISIRVSTVGNIKADIQIQPQLSLIKPRLDADCSLSRITS